MNEDDAIGVSPARAVGADHLSAMRCSLKYERDILRNRILAIMTCFQSIDTSCGIPTTVKVLCFQDVFVLV